IDDLHALLMKAVFSQLHLRTAEYEISQSGPVHLSLAEGIATIDQLVLTGHGTHLTIQGTAGLMDEQRLDMRLSGDVNAGIAALFSEGFQTAGAGRFELDLGGMLSAPELSGFLEVEQGQFNLPELRISARNLSVRLRVGSKGLTIERFNGSLNGGDLNISGRAGYAVLGLRDLNIDASFKNAYLDYPEGLRTQVSAELTLRSEGEFAVVGGEAHILQGSYRRPLDMTEEVLSYVRSGGGVQITEPDSFLSRLRFNVQLDTQGPLLIDNNLARLVARGNLRLVGSYLRPGLLGRVSLEEGGKLYFQERTYLIERGLVSFFNEAKIEPNLDILATTRAGEYDISLSLTGAPDDFSADLSSVPSLSQPDIIAVLLTGRKLEELQGSGLNVARRQVESYLSGQLAGFLSRGAEETLGLSMVRIDPSLINPETDPGARLTVGEDVTRSLRLIYSMNLVEAGDQILTAQYDVTRRFQTEATRQSDNTYRFEFRHGLQFGGSAGAGDTAASGAQDRKIGRIELLGNTVFSPDRVSDRLGFRTGDRYDFFRVQKGIDRLREYYRDRNRFECRIDVETIERDGLVDLSVRIDPGPEVDIAFEGISPSKDLRRLVREAWRDGLFDTQRVQDAVQAVRRSLARQDFLRAKVDARVSSSSTGQKRILIAVDAGARFRDVAMDFEGASGIDPSRLRALLESGRLTADIHLTPSKVKDYLERYYRREGYLDARIGDPRRDLSPETGTGRIVIPIEEGPRFTVRKLEFSGNTALADTHLRAALPLAVGDIYRSELLQASLGKLEELYWAKGYNNAVVSHTVNRAAEAGGVDIAFRITESRQQIVDRIEIEGNRSTSDSLVRSQMALSPGEILDHEKTSQSRRRLFETNAYTMVDVQAVPSGAPQQLTAGNLDPVTLKVKLKEVRPFELRYGGFYDTERGPGAIASFTNRNSLGSARLVGVRTRYDSDVREFRGYFSQPFLLRFPVDTNVTGFFRREITRGQDSPDFGFITDRTGFTLQQEARFRNNLILSYGYRFQRNHTYDMGPDPFFDITLKTAPLTATLTRDTRNDFLDASRGSFLSQAFEYAPSFLGSDLRFLKYLGQYFHYLPLSKPAEVPWVGDRRSRLVLAGAARVGLAGGLGGQDLILSDKFFAGGGTTIRGFGQNEVGPRDFFGDPAGGNALLIVNGELRFPLLGIFDGVGFLDLGNVFPRVGDFDPTNVRKSSGFGLRLRTPYFLLRADYGFKLDRKPGESLGRFFFSIGQAF
ncbi:MAG: translocation/assembly module TamB domain-containing protein, partial [Acidobacteria bacterium]|nr:translocation/assembly module TamB domain-containing protein [Acidobacteriota bacterium]